MLYCWNCAVEVTCELDEENPPQPLRPGAEMRCALVEEHGLALMHAHGMVLLFVEEASICCLHRRA